MRRSQTENGMKTTTQDLARRRRLRGRRCDRDAERRRAARRRRRRPQSPCSGDVAPTPRIPRTGPAGGVVVAQHGEHGGEGGEGGEEGGAKGVAKLPPDLAFRAADRAAARPSAGRRRTGQAAAMERGASAFPPSDRGDLRRHQGPACRLQRAAVRGRAQGAGRRRSRPRRAATTTPRRSRPSTTRSPPPTPA